MYIIEGYILNPGQRVYWLYLLSTLLIFLIYAVFIYVFKGQKIVQLEHVKSYWLHPSALLDYAYFLLNSLIKLFI
ncbi:MAG: hypothetical protein KGV48_001500, partial [Alcaligenaceae bacterium]|nr:hypothetical protein [Alcaligenaceae bacterium]